MTVRYYSSVAPETTLTAGITNASTSIQVASATGYPTNTPFVVAVDYEGATEELVLVTAVALTTFTVTRAFNGTSAASHNAGARVRHVSCAQDFTDSRDHENSSNGIHGLAPGDVLVGEDAVQTLTNKTLLAPVINGATISGTTSITGPANFSSSLNGSNVAVVRLDNINGVSLSSTNHAFQIGQSTGSNLRVDSNEVQAVNNGSASTFGINVSGGGVVAFNSLPADSVANTFNVNGVLAGTQVQSVRPSPTATNMSVRVTGDTNSRWLAQADGTNRWGPGNASSDAGISRTAPGVLAVDNTMNVPTLNISGTATNSGSGIKYRPSQTGTQVMSFLSNTDSTISVTFPVAFATVPTVMTNINSGDGSAARWGSRAISVTTTGFTLFVFASFGAPAQTWNNVPVQWLATTVG